MSMSNQQQEYSTGVEQDKGDATRDAGVTGVDAEEFRVTAAQVIHPFVLSLFLHQA